MLASIPHVLYRFLVFFKKRTSIRNHKANGVKISYVRNNPSNCLNWKNYSDDHSSLSSTTAEQHEFHIILYIYISHNFYCHIPLGHCAWLKSSPNDTIHLKWDGQFSISVDPPFCQWLANDSIFLASIQALQYCTCKGSSPGGGGLLYGTDGDARRKF